MSIHRTLVRHILAPLAGFLAVGLASSVASANYVCQTYLIPGSSTGGNEGYVQSSEYTGPNCTGNFVKSYYFCTTGATSSVCASSLSYRFERNYLSAMFQSLQRAAAADQRVDVLQTSCIGGASADCAGYARFFAN